MVVSDEREMSRLPRNLDELTSSEKPPRAHYWKDARTKAPGRFKADPNRAGSTLFVAPELVEGALAKGFEIYRGLLRPALNSPVTRGIAAAPTSLSPPDVVARQRVSRPGTVCRVHCKLPHVEQICVQ